MRFYPGSSIVTHLVGQDIHDISLLLGFEASRHLQEETFTGVRRLLIAGHACC